MQKKMYFNIVHRTGNTPEDFAMFRDQQDLAHRYGFKATMQIGATALGNPEIISYFKAQHEKFGDEISISFHPSELDNEEIRKLLKTPEFAIYLMHYEHKKMLIDHLFGRFRDAFGLYPASVGSYVLDSLSIKWIAGKYPGVKIAITNCFEEGINMFRGCNHTWYLFTEGGPWGAYYPSKENMLCPAVDKDNFCGIIGVSHLNRDMLLAIAGRDDYFSSHPANIMRGRANDGDECPYNYHFIDQWIKQLEFNDFVYYNIYIGTQWMKAGANFEEPTEYSVSLYADALKYLQKKKDEGVAEDMTMEEFAGWFAENVPIGKPEVNHWDDILCGSRRQIAWYVDPYMRVAVDPNMGGAISDLRPLIGQIEKNPGADTKHLHNSSYPFIINSQHRGGFIGGSIHCFEVGIHGKNRQLLNYRTQCVMSRDGRGNHRIMIDPVEVKIDDVVITVGSSYAFLGNGVIEIERTVLDCSDRGAEVAITEFHRGCWGDNQYPADMRGIELGAIDSAGHLQEHFSCDYRNRAATIAGAGSMRAAIPQGNCSVTLASAPGEKADSCFLEEGFMFCPFFTFRIIKKVKKGGTLTSWLTIAKK
jgi:hypothetical protein